MDSNPALPGDCRRAHSNAGLVTSWSPWESISSPDRDQLH